MKAITINKNRSSRLLTCDECKKGCDALIRFDNLYTEHEGGPAHVCLSCIKKALTKINQNQNG